MERSVADSRHNSVLITTARSSAAAGVHCVFLNGKDLRTSQRLFHSFALSLKFPDYFGQNWNALFDCLTDLAWLPAEGYEVVITNGMAVLTDEPLHPEFREPSDLAVLLDLLGRVTDEWNSPVSEGESWDRPAIPFNVRFVVDLDQVAALQDRFASVGRMIPYVEQT
jgi:Barstar (barnase inhibitor)